MQLPTRGALLHDIRQSDYIIGYVTSYVITRTAPLQAEPFQSKLIETVSRAITT
ncbi:hypothetical protein [Paenibacillus sp. PCH8]|uniref:hypothetical protein n=1 Tax=Paenibacillus sp. PCH8 TaxID=2066524 RepID=UPI0015E2CC77|nr:hypothetical protein [Paenibacillus sp. PCH8]